MAKLIIVSKKKLSLGPHFNSPQLKVGRNEFDEAIINQDTWFFNGLLASGTITIEVVPEPEEPEGLAEVVITEDKVEVFGPPVLGEEKEQEEVPASEIPGEIPAVIKPKLFRKLVEKDRKVEEKKKEVEKKEKPKIKRT